MSPIFSPTNKKVIFFDMNNTLIDRRQCFDSAFTDIVEEFTSRWEQDEVLWSSLDALRSYKEEWSKQRNVQSRSLIPPQELRKICLSKALKPYPVTVNTAFTKAFFERVEQSEDRYAALFPGVESTLKSLLSVYKLAIISNGNRQRLESNLSKLRLDQWIGAEHLFSSRGESPRKPHPGIFEAAMKEMKTTPGQSVMIGNSWKNDIVGGTRCGLDAVWIHPAHVKKISQRRLGKQKVVIIRFFPQLQQIF